MVPTGLGKRGFRVWTLILELWISGILFQPASSDGVIQVFGERRQCVWEFLHTVQSSFILTLFLFPILFSLSFLLKSPDSSVGIALGYGLDDRGSRVRFPVGAGNFSLHHRVQNGSGPHPVSYSMGTRGCFPVDKAAGAWSWPLTSTSAKVKEWMELYIHSRIHLHGVVLS
jgi:hypothetical protein